MAIMAMKVVIILALRLSAFNAKNPDYMLPKHDDLSVAPIALKCRGAVATDSEDIHE